MESGKRCRVVRTVMPFLRERSTAVSAEGTSGLCAIRGIAALLVRGSAIRAARCWLPSPPRPRPNCQPRTWSRTTPAGHSAISSRRTPRAAATTVRRSCPRLRPPGKRPLAPRPLPQRPPMSGAHGDGSPWGWGLPSSSPRRSSAISRCTTARGTRRRRRRGRSAQLPPHLPPLLPRRRPLLLPPRRPPLPPARHRRRPRPPFPRSGSFPRRPAGSWIRPTHTATTGASFLQGATSCPAGRSCRMNLAMASGKPSSGLCCPSPDFRLAACRTRVAFTSVRACPMDLQRRGSAPRRRPAALSSSPIAPLSAPPPPCRTAAWITARIHQDPRDTP